MQYMSFIMLTWHELAAVMAGHGWAVSGALGQGQAGQAAEVLTAISFAISK